jgi:16S rRNA A1518/A1519 N6-dimethyltransferase RsmA/KsgA/DIM1 with predicted DNA glycosylase/AP lyase activity
MTREDHLGPQAGPFGQFVQQLFSARRKTLRKSLGQGGYDADAALANANIDPKLRPEDLTPDQFRALFDAATAKQR